MGIIDSYQQKQLELEAAKEQERKELIAHSYELFDRLLNLNASSLEERIVRNGIFEGFFEIQKSFHYSSGLGNTEQPYFFYRQEGSESDEDLILKYGFRHEKHFHLFSDESYYVEVTKEGSYYIDEICKRFLKRVELGEDENFRYEAAICCGKEQRVLPCEITPGRYSGIGCCKLAIKYSLTKRK